MPKSCRTRNEHCIALERKYRSRRDELKKEIAKRRTNKDADINEHMRSVFSLHGLPRNSSSIRIRNRCSITGRGRGVYRFFGLCRVKIRELAMQGFLPGISHASW